MIVTNAKHVTVIAQVEEDLAWTYHLGIFKLLLGIIYHLRYMRTLRAEREAMTREGLIHGETPYPVSLTLLVATVMLLLGVLAIISMTAHIGPFD